MLTDTAIKNAKPKDRPYKMYDGRGLYVLVRKSGKYFRLDYSYLEKRKTLALGVYPDTSLADARDKQRDAKTLIAKNIDPSQHKQETRKALKAITNNTFEKVALEWYEKHIKTKSRKHAETVIQRLNYNVFPAIGTRPIQHITAPDILDMLKKIEDRGAIETAHRVKQICGQIFRFAIATKRVDRDPAADLKGALIPVQAKSMAAITKPKEIGALLRAIEGYSGYIATKCALKLAPLVFVRPGELRHAEWSEIDLENALWKIPGEKMKKGRVHLVPLSKQAIEILKTLQPITGAGRYVFPSLRTASRPMSNNTVLAALRRMGFEKDEMSGHGFRAMASTNLHEQGYPSAMIEMQLAHSEGNSVKAAYNHAEYLDKRRAMMQDWSNYLCALRDGATVIPIRKAAG